MKEEREKFAKEKLMFNYPHASEAIVADIKRKRVLSPFSDCEALDSGVIKIIQYWA